MTKYIKILEYDTQENITVPLIKTLLVIHNFILEHHTIIMYVIIFLFMLNCLQKIQTNSEFVVLFYKKQNMNLLNTIKTNEVVINELEQKIKDLSTENENIPNENEKFSKENEKLSKENEKLNKLLKSAFNKINIMEKIEQDQKILLLKYRKKYR
jgi:peptidoglycan hydrolase CwlO-like protein